MGVKTFKKYKEREAKIIKKEMLKEGKNGFRNVWIVSLFWRLCFSKTFGVSEIFCFPAPQQQCCSQALYV